MQIQVIERKMIARISATE